MIPTVPVVQMEERRRVMVKVTGEIRLWRKGESIGVGLHALVVIRA